MMIRFIFLMMLSFSVLSETQINWIAGELREDGSQIEAVEKYYLYHFYGSDLPDIIEISADSTSYLHNDSRVGIHIYEVSMLEGGQEGRRSYPIPIYTYPAARPTRLTLTLE